MKGTIFWVKIPQGSGMDVVERLKSSFNEALSKNLEPDDRMIFTVGDLDIKCFNGNLIELSETERRELVDKLLK